MTTAKRTKKPTAALAAGSVAATFEPIDSLVPWAKNPRHNDKAIGPVAASIRRFGFGAPLVARLADRMVIAGHTRLLAAKMLGLTEVPVRFVDLNEADATALAIADNKIGEISEWDVDKLGEELRSLDSAGFDLNGLGFDVAELDELLAQASGPSTTDPDEAPPLPSAATTFSRVGDVWALGNRRLACGDSTDPAVVAAAMDGQPADMCWCDPPYNVAYKGSAGTIMNDNMKAAAFSDFLKAAFTAAFSVLKPGAAIYVAHADTERVSFTSAFQQVGFKLSGVLIWVKNALVLGRSDYQWKHEPILYGWKPGASHQFFGGRAKTTVVECDRPTSSKLHPTMKPVALVEAQIANSSKRGALVLDMFGGSGTTLVACEKSGRHARLVELDPRFCDVIVTRWEQFTGKKAVRLVAGAGPVPKDEQPAAADADGPVEADAGEASPASSL